LDHDMMSLLRAAFVGVAYAMAVGIVDKWLGAIRNLDLGLPPMAWTTLEVTALELLLGLCLGLATSGLRRLFGTAWLQLLAVATAWIALSYHVAVDPEHVKQWLLAPAVGLALAAVGLLVARGYPRLP
jgi:hypothetical protein